MQSGCLCVLSYTSVRQAPEKLQEALKKTNNVPCHVPGRDLSAPLVEKDVGQAICKMLSAFIFYIIKRFILAATQSHKQISG